MELIAQRRFSHVLQIFFALTLALSGAVLAASPASATDPLIITFTNQWARAEGTTYTDCSDTVGVVRRGGIVIRSSISAGFQASNQPQINYSDLVYNDCTGVYSFRYGQATPDLYSFNSESARVKATVSLDDGTEPILLDLTWTRIGQPIRSSTKSKSILPGGWVYSDSSRGTYSKAAFTGPFVASSASMSNERLSKLEIVIQHP